ncbi:hypothetical protein HBI56_224680 [Parastagonospora nodorum]|nr:hypothetical protein HBH56_093490 [Parastagonospora nodorum]KAH3921627.1 hypothetical protein HBH54_237660 [Parastagonospora nodorum]KAH3939800.1 hypothetical protein HBH53_229600 [Parastagonospora nodorum]KAH3957894.1 hypothetical protein HBH51_218130 [Parastagonospora nodorum]KAH3967272.1 hypothetical protein HBH52_187360 [Parastagonospora nodorum]
MRDRVFQASSTRFLGVFQAFSRRLSGVWAFSRRLPGVFHDASRPLLHFFSQQPCWASNTGKQRTATEKRRRAGFLGRYDSVGIDCYRNGDGALVAPPPPRPLLQLSPASPPSIIASGKIELESRGHQCRAASIAQAHKQQPSCTRPTLSPQVEPMIRQPTPGEGGTLPKSVDSQLQQCSGGCFVMAVRAHAAMRPPWSAAGRRASAGRRCLYPA